MSWSQPICRDCWFERNPGREPVRVVAIEAPHEVCCYCGTPNFDGIYVRVDPTTVPYPMRDE